MTREKGANFNLAFRNLNGKESLRVNIRHFVNVADFVTMPGSFRGNEVVILSVDGRCHSHNLPSYLDEDVVNAPVGENLKISLI
jgi:hypothetical protein